LTGCFSGKGFAAWAGTWAAYRKFNYSIEKRKIVITIIRIRDSE